MSTSRRKSISDDKQIVLGVLSARLEDLQSHVSCKVQPCPYAKSGVVHDTQLLLRHGPAAGKVADRLGLAGKLHLGNMHVSRSHGEELKKMTTKLFELFPFLVVDRPRAVNGKHHVAIPVALWSRWRVCRR